MNKWQAVCQYFAISIVNAFSMVVAACVGADRLSCVVCSHAQASHTKTLMIRGDPQRSVDGKHVCAIYHHWKTRARPFFCPLPVPLSPLHVCVCVFVCLRSASNFHSFHRQANNNRHTNMNCGTRKNQHDSQMQNWKLPWIALLITLI